MSEYAEVGRLLHEILLLLGKNQNLILSPEETDPDDGPCWMAELTTDNGQEPTKTDYFDDEIFVELLGKVLEHLLIQST